MTQAQRTMVSLAGPFANVVLAVLLLALTAVFCDPEHSVFWGGDGVPGLPPGHGACC